MSEFRRRRRAGQLAGAAAAVLLLAGCSSGAAPGPAPTQGSASPAVEASQPAGTPSPAAADGAPQEALPEVLEDSEPVSLSIASTGTVSEVIDLGLRDDGTLEVPPESPGAPASWYTGSPAPGDRGPSVLLGHVNDSEGGAGVFADLRSLDPGDTVEIAREDGSTATFAVDRGAQYEKDEFPTLEVYGNTQDAQLRLITCDGYDPATGLFDDNYVVYASLVT